MAKEKFNPAHDPVYKKTKMTCISKMSPVCNGSYYEDLIIYSPILGRPINVYTKGVCPRCKALEDYKNSGDRTGDFEKVPQRTVRRGVS